MFPSTKYSGYIISTIFFVSGLVTLLQVNHHLYHYYHQDRHLYHYYHQKSWFNIVIFITIIIKIVIFIPIFITMIITDQWSEQSGLPFADHPRRNFLLPGTHTRHLKVDHHRLRRHCHLLKHHHHCHPHTQPHAIMTYHHIQRLNSPVFRNLNAQRSFKTKHGWAKISMVVAFSEDCLNSNRIHFSLEGWQRDLNHRNLESGSGDGRQEWDLAGAVEHLKHKKCESVWCQWMIVF